MDWLKTFKKRFLTVSALALVTLAPTVEAAWFPDPTINTRVSDMGSVQDDPATVTDGAGGVYVIWENSGPDDIRAQHFNEVGIPLWPQNGIEVAWNGYVEQQYAAAVSDGVGGVIITWYEGDAGAEYDVWAQRLSPSGILLWGPNGVPVAETTGGQMRPVIAPDGAGGALIAWTDTRVGWNEPDIYAQRLDASGQPLWTVNGVGACTAAGYQQQPAIVRDGSGGAVVSWTDSRSGTADIYAQRISAGGAPQWTLNGVAISTAANAQQNSTLAEYLGTVFVAWMDLRNDGGDVFAQKIDAAGAIQWAANGVAVCWAAGTQSGIGMVPNYGTPVVSWQDERNGTSNRDIYAQRLSSAGGAMWAANGIAVCAAPGNQTSLNIDAPQVNIVPDTGYGTIIVWSDARNGGSDDIYAQHVSQTGAALWAVNGIAVSTAPYSQSRPAPIHDGADGLIVAWQDGRSSEIYAQLVRSTGVLGSPPEPYLLHVTDVPNDQGGKVEVEWGASSFDYDPSFGIANYTVWRRVPTAQGAAAPAAGIPGGDGVVRAGRDRIQTAGAGGQAVYWEYIATVPARGFPGYSYVAETTSDSLGGSNPYTHFMILAEETGGVPFYASQADSGYSVDNLSPASPWPVGGQYTAGSVRLHWAPNAEDDFAGYRIYKGSSAGFQTDQTCLLASTSDTTCVDAGQPGSYYKLTAFDVHGNESPATLLSPAQISAAEEAASSGAIRFGAPWPNPSGGSVAFRVSLPGTADVRVTVYDVLGRKVREVAAERTPGGQHVYRWDGRQAQGAPCAAGVYFARLEVDGQPRGTHRITIVR